MPANNNGKGDDPRPFSVSKKEYDRNFDKAFPMCDCGRKTKRACEELRCIGPKKDKG